MAAQADCPYRFFHDREVGLIYRYYCETDCRPVGLPFRLPGEIATLPRLQCSRPLGGDDFAIVEEVGRRLTTDWDRRYTASLAGRHGHYWPQLLRIGQKKASLLIREAIAAETGAEKRSLNATTGSSIGLAYLGSTLAAATSIDAILLIARDTTPGQEFFC